MPGRLQNSENRSWPVGMKKPNDFGLFDVLGNVWCWCQNRFPVNPQIAAGRDLEDVEDDKDVQGIEMRTTPSGCEGAFSKIALPICAALVTQLRPAGRQQCGISACQNFVRAALRFLIRFRL